MPGVFKLAARKHTADMFVFPTSTSASRLKTSKDRVARACEPLRAVCQELGGVVYLCCVPIPWVLLSRLTVFCSIPKQSPGHLALLIPFLSFLVERRHR